MAYFQQKNRFNSTKNSFIFNEKLVYIFKTKNAYIQLKKSVILKNAYFVIKKLHKFTKNRLLKKNLQ